ncbi:hypothetical protein [Stenotrophomonas indicatrix]|uniref:hypothetical protein n=1 Tax=Stenotrophomonas indicatrix TaxID=2045451 RepID=UPI001CC14BB7|nr:hypothetical protein [Stenotrophomonas indicatrix]
MKVKTEIGIKRGNANGEEVIRTISEDVQIIDVNTQGLRPMAELASRHAQSCIYCDSRDQLSSEHIVPYAWGGTLQVHSGSCEVCRLITSAFENYALNDGAMAHVRKSIGLPSRSNHSSAKGAIEMALENRDGQALTIEVGTDVPAILGLPLFVRPGLLNGDGRRTALDLEGMAAVAFGADLSAFMEGHSAAGAVQRESTKRVMAFARTIAKIAYCWAWRDGVIERIGRARDLVDAFMHHPESLGAFIGTKPPPYERYYGCQLRIEYKLSMPRQLVYLEVQMFADTAAPTYEVVLGRVESIREWRNLCRSFCR